LCKRSVEWIDFPSAFHQDKHHETLQHDRL
jgi:hypothetical protein